MESESKFRVTLRDKVLALKHCEQATVVVLKRLLA